MTRIQWLTAALLVAIATVAGLWFGRPVGSPPLIGSNQVGSGQVGSGQVGSGQHGSSQVGQSSAPITVHAAGEVELPGLVEVPVGSRVAAVIEAAGGFTAEADQSAINLAAAVVDGQQIVVYPRPAAGGAAGGIVETGDGRVVVNQAQVSDLESIPGVGEVLAERIASFRAANGPFVTVEDLLDVPGIGEAKLAGMRDYIRIP
jgi:competence protein ComEA